MIKTLPNFGIVLFAQQVDINQGLGSLRQELALENIAVFVTRCYVFPIDSVVYMLHLWLYLVSMTCRSAMYLRVENLQACLNAPSGFLLQIRTAFILV